MPRTYPCVQEASSPPRHIILSAYGLSSKVSLVTLALQRPIIQGKTQQVPTPPCPLRVKQIGFWVNLSLSEALQDSLELAHRAITVSPWGLCEHARRPCPSICSRLFVSQNLARRDLTGGADLGACPP